jgi:hypothetical protein
MKKLVIVLVLFGLVSVSNATYVETFDTGSDSWNYGYGTNFTPGVTTWNAAGGNPGGYISGVSQNLYAVWTYVTAPYGDMTGLTLTIDTKVTNSETGNAQFYVGRGGAYFIDGAWAIGADTTWTTHRVILDASHFTKWTGVDTGAYTFAQVLQAPDDIGIFFGGSVASGAGNVLVDNFGTIPEPATICLLGLGALSLLKKRRA